MYLETSKDNKIGNKLYSATNFDLMNSVNFYEWTNK
jgi:hypothetical protein